MQVSVWASGTSRACTATSSPPMPSAWVGLLVQPNRTSYRGFHSKVSISARPFLYSRVVLSPWV